MAIPAFLPVMLLLAASASGTTYYVSTSGDDSWSGTSPDSAFATLQHAADIVTAGDSVLTLDGAYAGFDLRTSGSQEQPIVFACPGGAVVIDVENPVTPDGINIETADWVTIDGFDVIGINRNGVRTALGEHVTIRGCYCEGCYERGIFTAFVDHAVIEYNECCYSQDEHGIYHSNSGDYPLIRHNVCHHNNGCGIHMNGDLSAGGDGIISEAVVECNIVYENGNGGGSGINCDCVIDSEIFDNLLYMNHSSGISLYRIDGATGSTGNQVLNNTVIQPSDGRWCLNINTGSTGNTALNNILLSAHSWRGSICIDASSQPGFKSDYNTTEDRMSADGGNTVITLSEWQSLGYDPHSQLDPGWGELFVDWQGSDYHLCSGSPAIDSGTDAVSGIVDYDLDGVSRPQLLDWDAGGYEYMPTGTGQSPGIQPTAPAWSHGADGIGFRGLVAGSRIILFDVSGRRMAGLTATGPSLLWTGRGYPPGIYLVLILSPEGGALATGTALLLR